MDDQSLLELGKKVHALFDDEKRYHVSVYGVGWETGRVKDLEHYYCHMGLMNQGYHAVGLSKGKGPVVISNQVQTNYDDDGEILNKKDREKFFSFLFTDSVFAKCYVPMDPGKCDEDGITVRTDLPANLVVAACIATRQAWEHPEVGRTVLRLIKFGVSPRKAHMAAHTIIVKEDGSYHICKKHGHIAVYTNSMGKKAVSNFLSGTLCSEVVFNNMSYHNVRDYKGIPNMWGVKDHKCFEIDCLGQPAAQDQSDPFKFIKHAGEIQKVDVVQAVEEAFERILR